MASLIYDLNAIAFVEAILLRGLCCGSKDRSAAAEMHFLTHLSLVMNPTHNILKDER